MVTTHSLGWLLLSTIALEVHYQPLHLGQGVGEPAVAQTSDGGLDPLEEVGCHGIIVLLEVLNVNHDPNDLVEATPTCEGVISQSMFELHTHTNMNKLLY